MRYLAIGHICRDIIPEGWRLGGSVAYAALCAKYLGWKAEIITRAEKDFLDLPELADVRSLCFLSEKTTSFENIHNENKRQLILRARAGQIVFSGQIKADIIHLAPVIGEIDLSAIKGICENYFVGITPQGWLRQADGDGVISPKHWNEAEHVLACATAAALSIEDMGGDWGLLESWARFLKVMAVTQGPDGATIFWNYGREKERVVACGVEAVDPTGAGDVFAAAFFIGLREGKNPIKAAIAANKLAAYSVKYQGILGLLPQAKKAFI